MNTAAVAIYIRDAISLFTILSGRQSVEYATNVLSWVKQEQDSRDRLDLVLTLTDISDISVMQKRIDALMRLAPLSAPPLTPVYNNTLLPRKAPTGWQSIYKNDIENMWRDKIRSMKIQLSSVCQICGEQGDRPSVSLCSCAERRFVNSLTYEEFFQYIHQ